MKEELEFIYIIVLCLVIIGGGVYLVAFSKKKIPKLDYERVSEKYLNVGGIIGYIVIGLGSIWTIFVLYRFL